jgi:hypothetical protein
MLTISSTNSRWTAFAAGNSAAANFIAITSAATTNTNAVLVVPDSMIPLFPAGSYSRL